MLDSIANNADLIIAGVQTALTLDMLPTIWTQFRARASTVPLTSSIPTAVGLSVLGLVFFATGLYIATATVLIGSAVWAVVAGQRIGYSRHDGSATQTPDADPELRADDSRLSGSGTTRRGTAANGHSCLHYVRAGWCGHRNRAPRRSSRQATGVGMGGDSQSTSSSIEEVPDLVQHTPATTHNQRGDCIELETKVCNCKYSGFIDFCGPPCPIHQVKGELD